MTSPNILLVTIDSLRADHAYGDAASTPAHDHLSEQGETYTNAFAQGPFTTFSMPSLFTGRYPSGLQYLEFSDQTIGVYIDDEPTLPERLSSAGYATAGFHSNPLLSNLFGFDRGFNTFDARLPLSNTDFLPGRAKILTDKLLRLVRKHAYVPAHKLNERALQWLDNHEPDRPFFLWLHYMDVHGPYQAKEGNSYLNKFRGERLWRKAVTRGAEVSEAEHTRLRELYREEIEYTDRCLAYLLAELRRRGHRDETVVAVTADHGELFGEHSRYSHPHLLYDELTNVPLIISRPDGPADATKQSVTELVDLTPSLLSCAGVEPPDSMAGTMLGGNETDEIAISEADLVPDYNGSVRVPEYRYIRNEAAGGEELYRIEHSSKRQVNLADESPDALSRLSERLDAHLSDPRRAVGPDRDIERKRIDDEGVQDRLRDLGYID